MLDGVPSARRAIAVTASTDAVDSWGEIVEQSWDLERFAKNPIVLWQHDRREPIGTAENVRVEGGALKATLVIAPEGVSKEADKAWSLYEAGILRAVSVGFAPRDIRYEKRNGVEVAVLANNELREISIVSLPANPEAVIEARVKHAEASRRQQPEIPAKEPKRMDSIVKALGLPDGSTEQDIVASASKLLGSLNAKSLSEALGKIQGLQAVAVQAEKDAAALADVRAAERERKATDMVERAIADGRITPAARDATIAKAKADPEFMEGFLQMLPVIVKTAPSVSAKSNASGLTDSELRVCKMLGLTPEQFAAEKALRANANTSEEG
jgi:HK97 family phage prohead protease